MAQAQSPGATVIDAVMMQAQSEARRWQSNVKFAASHREQARELQDEADANRERWESCKTWLDENAPGWLQAIPEDKRGDYVLAIQTDEEVHAST